MADSRLRASRIAAFSTPRSVTGQGHRRARIPAGALAYLVASLRSGPYASIGDPLNSLLAALLAGALGFGPADPLPPRAATCFDADADTIAIGRETARGWVIETSTAEGPWQRVMGPVATRDAFCPVLAAASDGTAVVAAGTGERLRRPQVAIRPPGGDFGAPAALSGRRTDTLVTAAAPGGQVAILWGPRERATRKIALNVLVATPGRPSTRTVVARSGTIEHPGLAIAPDGTATAVWNAVHPYRKRMSEFRHRTWSGPVDLAADPAFDYGESGVAVDTAPNGRRLLAWKAGDGVHVQADGEPGTIVATPEYADAITAALADDGSAMVTFVEDGGALLAVDRASGGPWSPPHPLPLGREIPDISFRGDLLGQQVSLAPGGQVVVTWPLENGRVVAVQGQTGGAWDATASLLSSPVRYASNPKLVNGEIVWLEPEGAGRPGALRGSRLGAPAPTDTIAPKFSVGVSRRLARRQPGPITVLIEVRCAEACDALARFDGVEDYAARSLVAGKPATLRVPAYLPEGRGDFRLRIGVAVADRAGNQRRRSVRVQIGRR